MTYRDANTYFRRCLLDAITGEMRKNRIVALDRPRADVLIIRAVEYRNGDSPIAVSRKTSGEMERSNGKS